MKRRKIFVVLSLCIVSLVCFSGCLFAVKPWERKKLYKYYSNDENYIAIQGNIRSCKYYEDGRVSFTIEFNQECLENLGEEVKRFMFLNDEPVAAFKTAAKNQQILLENNFYELFEELNPTQGGVFILNYTVELITSPKIWWDGWSPVFVGVKVGEQIYLDYETGKTNLLDWIQNDLI